jgi:hypothetical protein
MTTAKSEAVSYRFINFSQTEQGASNFSMLNVSLGLAIKAAVSYASLWEVKITGSRFSCPDHWIWKWGMERPARIAVR